MNCLRNLSGCIGGWIGRTFKAQLSLCFDGIEAAIIVAVLAASIVISTTVIMTVAIVVVTVVVSIICGPLVVLLIGSTTKSVCLSKVGNHPRPHAFSTWISFHELVLWLHLHEQHGSLGSV